MGTLAHNYPKQTKTAFSSRIGVWVSRLPLVLATLIFTAISLRFLIAPVQSAAAQGISFNTAVGVTVARIGFGAFPLAFAIITLSCLISRQRLLTGIYIVLTVIGVALVVRVFGMLVDNSVKESMKVLTPEVVMLVLSLIALNLERRRRAIDGNG